RRIHPDELLGRIQKRAEYDLAGQAATPPGIRLPKLRSASPGRSALEMRPVHTEFRHVPIQCGLSTLRSAVSQHHVRRMPEEASDKRVAGRRERAPNRSGSGLGVEIGAVAAS